MNNRNLVRNNIINWVLLGLLFLFVFLPIYSIGGSSSSIFDFSRQASIFFVPILVPIALFILTLFLLKERIIAIVNSLVATFILGSVLTFMSAAKVALSFFSFELHFWAVLYILLLLLFLAWNLIILFSNKHKQISEHFIKFTKNTSKFVSEKASEAADAVSDKAKEVKEDIEVKKAEKETERLVEEAKRETEEKTKNFFRDPDQVGHFGSNPEEKFENAKDKTIISKDKLETRELYDKINNSQADVENDDDIIID